MSDASTELSMTFSIDVAPALSHRVWHCYSGLSMTFSIDVALALLFWSWQTFSQQSVFGHCHSELRRRVRQCRQRIIHLSDGSIGSMTFLPLKWFGQPEDYSPPAGVFVVKVT